MRLVNVRFNKNYFGLDNDEYVRIECTSENNKAFTSGGGNYRIYVELTPLHYLLETLTALLAAPNEQTPAEPRKSAYTKQPS